MTTIYVDGDACPVREEIFRVATRLELPVVVVSNGSRSARPSDLPHVRQVVVAEGADAADDWIVEHIARGDVCCTGDIPLAARCLEKGARALSPRGHAWTTDNIGSALAGRDISQARRDAGLVTGGPPPLTRDDRSRFLSALDAMVGAVRRDKTAAASRPWVSFE